MSNSYLYLMLIIVAPVFDGVGWLIAKSYYDYLLKIQNIK